MKKKDEQKSAKVKTVDQLTIAKMIADKTGLTITEITEIIELEQKLTMSFIKKGRKVIKKNYLTLTPCIVKSRSLKCPLNSKDYEIPAHLSVTVRVGSGFKAYLNDSKKMPDCYLCNKNNKEYSNYK